jgi:lipopolysaccharide transport system ATP-binding protein
MSDDIIVFEDVAKSFSIGLHKTGGIKNLLLTLPEQLRMLRKSRHEVFHDLSFSILRGETFGVIGRNGAGKSTLLGLMAGVIRPTRGRVDVRGRTSPLLELGAGFHPELSGLDNILLNGVLLGLPKRMVEKRLDDIVAFSELGELIDQPVRSYSSGMKMRLGFSVVAHLEPEILLIDEILTVGDADFQEKCRAKINEFQSAGVTIVLVSHNMDDVRELCNRAALLDDKSFALIGSPAEVVAAYQQRTANA